jgi:hypothetical protein
MKSALILAAIIVALSASSVSACPPCPQGMTTVNVDLAVAGEDCSMWTPAVDSQKFTVAEAGKYDVYGYVVRGGDFVCETKEEFFTSFYTSIGNANGPVLTDGSCAWSETLLPLGTFDLVTGHNKNTVKMTSTAPRCGRTNHIPNDVQIVKLCIAEVPPSAPEFPIPAVAALCVFAAIPAAAFVSRKK